MYVYKVKFEIDNGCWITHVYRGVASTTPLSKERIQSFLSRKHNDYDTTIELLSCSLVNPTNEEPIILI